MKTFILLFVSLWIVSSSGFSVNDKSSSRRGFLTKSVASTAALIGASTFVAPSIAAPEIFNTPSGLKYAVTQQPPDPKKATIPAKGDIVAIEYTGYLTNGNIFDGTHSEGKGNALTFKLGDTVVVDGVNEIVSMMGVGQKVQVIVPPKLAFGDKGLCLESGECLIKPGATLVYDVKLKRTAIPPP